MLVTDRNLFGQDERERESWWKNDDKTTAGVTLTRLANDQLTDEADATGRLDIARALAITDGAPEKERKFFFPFPYVTLYYVFFFRDLPAPDSAAGHIIRVTAGASRLAPSPECSNKVEILEQQSNSNKRKHVNSDSSYISCCASFLNVFRFSLEKYKFQKKKGHTTRLIRTYSFQRRIQNPEMHISSVSREKRNGNVVEE